MRTSDLLVSSAIRKYSCGHKQVVERSSAEQALFALKRALEWSTIPFSERKGIWAIARRDEKLPVHL